MSEEVKAPTTIAIDSKSQMLIARDNFELMRMIRIFMKGVAFPKSLDTEEKIIAAWQVAASLKIPPMIAMQNMAVINGSVAIWGQLPKALAEATGELEKFRLFYIDKEHNEISLANKNLNVDPWAAVVQMARKGRATNEYFFSTDDAQKAGLLNKSGPWKDYRKVMLARRAMGQAIKFEFPDALMGISIAEYDHHEAPDLKDVTPAKAVRDANAASQFWEEIHGKPTASAPVDVIERSEAMARRTGDENRDVEAGGNQL